MKPNDDPFVQHAAPAAGELVVVALVEVLDEVEGGEAAPGEEALADRPHVQVPPDEHHPGFPLLALLPRPLMIAVPRSVISIQSPWRQTPGNMSK